MTSIIYSNQAMVGSTVVALAGFAEDGVVLAVPRQASQALVRGLIEMELRLARDVGTEAPAAWDHAHVVGRFLVAAALYDDGWRPLDEGTRLGSPPWNYALFASTRLSDERAREIARKAAARCADPNQLQLVPSFHEIVLYALAYQRLRDGGLGEGVV